MRSFSCSHPVSGKGAAGIGSGALVFLPGRGRHGFGRPADNALGVAADLGRPAPFWSSSPIPGPAGGAPGPYRCIGSVSCPGGSGWPAAQRAGIPVRIVGAGTVRPCPPEAFLGVPLGVAPNRGRSASRRYSRRRVVGLWFGVLPSDHDNSCPDEASSAVGESLDAIEFVSGIGGFAAAADSLNRRLAGRVRVVAAFDQGAEANAVYHLNHELAPQSRNLDSIPPDAIPVGPPRAAFSPLSKEYFIGDTACTEAFHDVPPGLARDANLGVG